MFNLFQNALFLTKYLYQISKFDFCNAFDQTISKFDLYNAFHQTISKFDLYNAFDQTISKFDLCNAFDQTLPDSCGDESEGEYDNPGHAEELLHRLGDETDLEVLLPTILPNVKDR